MGASRHIGQVGGLAVALGVGAAIFTVSGEAWADTESGGSQGQARASSSSSQASGRSARSVKAGPTAASKSISSNNSRRTAAPAATARKAFAPLRRHVCRRLPRQWPARWRQPPQRRPAVRRPAHPVWATRPFWRHWSS